jgi:hypothetical protein
MENQQQAPVLSTREWVITLLIRIIPLVGFVMLFVWAFGNNDNPNRANWAKAALIVMVIGFVLGAILIGLFWAPLAVMSSKGGFGD